MNDIKLMKVITSLLKEVDEIYSVHLKDKSNNKQLAPEFSHVKYLESLYLGMLVLF